MLPKVPLCGSTLSTHIYSSLVTSAAVAVYERTKPFSARVSCKNSPEVLRCGMDQTVYNSSLCMAEKLERAQRVFEEFHSRCFWFMRRDIRISEADLPYICERLRADGGRRGFAVAAEWRIATRNNCKERHVRSNR